MLQEFKPSFYLRYVYAQAGYQYNPKAETIEDQLKGCLDPLERKTPYQATDTMIEAIQTAKLRFILLWSWAHFHQSLSLYKLGQWQSKLADATFDCVLRSTWCLPKFQQTLQKDYKDGRVPGLFILGLGKLGGNDLNFSSDVDLIAFFDADLLPIKPFYGKNDIANRVLKQVHQALCYGSSANIWRIDWRLRPEVSTTGLAISTQVAENFYFYRAPTWHRLALLKARVIAGDQASSTRFLDTLQPYIWRKNLDYTVIDELHHLKTRINLEHPSLKLQRAQQHQITESSEGFNVKLGTGGIREIEFIINGLQMLFGGRITALRLTNTIEAIQQLQNEGLLDSQEAELLVSAYSFLRRLENGLQMLNDQQTHQIPSNNRSKQQLMQLLSIADWSAFSLQLWQFRTQVHSHFNGLFAEGNTNSTEPPIIPELTGHLDERAQNIIDSWHQGFICYGISPQRAVILSETLLPVILNSIKRYSNPDHYQSSIAALDYFFKNLPQGEQYFSILQQKSQLVDTLTMALLVSPPMASLLSQSPHIIDSLVVKKFRRWDNIIPFVKDPESQSNALRRQVNEYLFQIYLRIINHDLTAEKAYQELTTTALLSLSSAVDIVNSQMLLEKIPISIVALGRMGMGVMSPKSDLDVIFISEITEELELAGRFCRRLQTTLSMRMREGVVYEMDTRLRPSGRLGAIVVSPENWKRYLTTKAFTWEHLALVPAKPIWGSPQLKQTIIDIRRDILTMHRSKQQCINDVHKMLKRIQEQRIKEPRSGFDVKLMPGGILECDFLIAFLVLLNAKRDTSLADITYNEVVERLDKNYGYSGLHTIWTFYNKLNIWTRILGLSEQPLDSLPAFVDTCLLKAFDIKNTQDLIAITTDYGQQVRSWLNTILKASSLKDKAKSRDWQETPVEQIL